MKLDQQSVEQDTMKDMFKYRLKQEVETKITVVTREMRREQEIKEGKCYTIDGFVFSESHLSEIIAKSEENPVFKPGRFFSIMFNHFLMTFVGHPVAIPILFIKDGFSLNMQFNQMFLRVHMLMIM